MSPLKHSNNLAARMGRWSANHWKTAVFGWLAFVVASVVIGGAVGTKYLEDNDLAVGEAGTADKIIEAGFPETADEQGEIVLIQSKTLTADDPAFKAAIEDVTKTLDAFPQVRKLDSPLDAGHADLISDDGHSAHGAVQPARAPTTRRRSTSRTIEAAVDKTAAAAPGLRRSTSSAASAPARHADDAFNSMLAKAGMIALPLTLVILLVVFGSAVAALVPLLLAITAVFATTSLIALPEPVHPGRRVDRRGDPPDRPRRRHRLLALLPPARARRACRRSQRARRARGRRSHLRPRRPHLRHHRPDRDGRHVPLRRQDVHVLLDRDDDGRRGRDDRLADRAPGAARRGSATGSRRAASRSCTGSGARTARAASGERSSTASCAARSSRPSPPAQCSSP